MFFGLGEETTLSEVCVCLHVAGNIFYPRGGGVFGVVEDTKGVFFQDDVVWEDERGRVFSRRRYPSGIRAESRLFALVGV